LQNKTDVLKSGAKGTDFVDEKGGIAKIFAINRDDGETIRTVSQSQIT